jgi:hypothetical protein
MFWGVFFWVFLIEKKYPTKYTTQKKYTGKNKISKQNTPAISRVRARNCIFGALCYCILQSTWLGRTWSGVFLVRCVLSI